MKLVMLKQRALYTWKPWDGKSPWCNVSPGTHFTGREKVGNDDHFSTYRLIVLAAEKLTKQH